MQKICQFVIITIIVSLFTSCGSSTSKASKDVELVIWVTYKGTEYKKFQELVDKFVIHYKKTKGKKIIISPKQVPFEGLVTSVKMACMSSRTPDIARVDVQKILELAYPKVLVKLDELKNFEAKSIEEKAKEYQKIPFYTNVVETKNAQGKYEKHLYGLPEQPTCLALFWNKRLFREAGSDLRKAGLDPTRAPRDWDEFVQYAKILTRKVGSDHQYGFAMNNSLWWTLPFLGGFKAQFVKKDENGKKYCGLDDKRSKAAFQFKVDLYRKYKVEAGAWVSGGISPEAGFVNEKYAMILMGTWNVERFKKKKLDFGVSLIPGISKRQAKELGIKNPPRSATNIGGNNLVIFQSCKHKEEAYEFINFLTSWENQLDWCQELKQIPASKKASDILLGKDKTYKKEVYTDPIIKTFMKQINYAILPPPLPMQGFIETDVINPEMELVLTGVKTIDDAMRATVKRIDTKVLSLVNE